jgi:hypothetical protein
LTLQTEAVAQQAKLPSDLFRVSQVDDCAKQRRK